MGELQEALVGSRRVLNESERVAEGEGDQEVGRVHVGSAEQRVGLEDYLEVLVLLLSPELRPVVEHAVQVYEFIGATRVVSPENGLIVRESERDVAKINVVLFVAILFDLANKELRARIEQNSAPGSLLLVRIVS